MCGIAGILSPRRRTNPEAVLRRMLHKIRYRGPEEVGVYAGPGIGLGHARLSIIDLATGQQPMGNDQGTRWIVFNGEIFNFVEIRESMKARGHRFRTTSDTEVLLRHLEEKGPGGLNDLNGQFSFAVWDTRARSLFLARDRVGICPLFYTVHDGDFLFSSEIKGIFADPRISREIDPVALDDVFTFWFPLSPATAFKGIMELPPAHYMTVTEDGAVRRERYWDLPKQGWSGDGKTRDADACAEELRSSLVDATRIRLRADVPVGAYLSGGLDSSVTASIVRSSFPDNELRTFSVRFEDPEFDEGEKQAVMSRHLGTRHEEIFCGGEDIASVFADVIWHAETPLVRTAPAPLFLLSKLVREKGFKVVLTGEGADEILAGYDIFKEARVRRFIEAAPASTVRPLLLQRLYPYLRHSPAQAIAYARRFFLAPPDPFGAEFHSHAPRWNMTAIGKSFFSGELKERLGRSDASQVRIAELLDGCAGYREKDPLSWAQEIEIKTLLPSYLLSSQGDRMLMANAVEGRFPFLDHRVIEFCMGLPPALRMRGLREKRLLRKSFSGLLPKSIAAMVKQPYRAPDSRSFLAGGAARAGAAELLSPEAVRRKGYFDPEMVRRLSEKWRANRIIGFKDNMAFVAILSTHMLDEMFVSRFPASGEIVAEEIATHRVEGEAM